MEDNISRAQREPADVSGGLSSCKGPNARDKGADRGMTSPMRAALLVFLALAGAPQPTRTVAKELAESKREGSSGGPVTFTLDGGASSGWVLLVGNDGSVNLQDYRAHPVRRFQMLYTPENGCIIVRESGPQAPVGDAAAATISVKDRSVREAAACPSLRDT